MALFNCLAPVSRFSSGCFQAPFSSSRFPFVTTSTTISSSQMVQNIVLQNVGRRSPRSKNQLKPSPRSKNQQSHVLAFVGQVEENPIILPDQKEDVEDDISQATLIWRAIKLPIYSVALIPLTVGAGAAYFQTGLFSARRYFGLLASSICIISWLNLSNDVYDFDTGADKNKKESVVNMVGSRTGTLVAAYILLELGFMGLIWVAVEAGSFRSILLLACAVICGYIYQCPPFRLSYHGLGEPLCFAAFGPFATTAFYLMQNSSRQANHFQSLSGTVLAVSILVGCTTSLILFCSHFHQVEGDKAVGKLSPLVRIGTKTGSEIVKMTIITLYALTFIFSLTRALPLYSTVLCALTLPIGCLVYSFVEQNYNDKVKIFMAKYYCVRLHTLFGMALALGLVLARKLR